jgi:hypothetical protein
MIKKEDTEVFEVWLNNKKIDELIEKLKELEENKEHIHFDDKKKNHIIFIHEGTEIL